MTLKLSRYNLEMPDGNGMHLFNTYSGASVFIATETFQLIKDLVSQPGDGAEEWSAVADFMVEHGFLVPADTDELDLALAKYDKTIADDSSLSLVIAPSLDCNMNCYYCYEGKRSDAALATPDIGALLSFVGSRLTPHGTLGVTWFGGEPLLSKAFIIEAARRLGDLCRTMSVNYTFRVVSNGHLLDEHTARTLSACGIESVQVTFDGCRDDHDRVRRSSLDGRARQGSFDRIIANVASASRHLRILARVNVSQRNIDRIDRLLQQMDEAGLQDQISSIYFYPVFSYKATDPSSDYMPRNGLHFSMEEFARIEPRLIDLAREHGFKIFTPVVFESGYLGCYASIANGFVIDPRGAILKCDHELGADSPVTSSIHDFTRLQNDEALQKWARIRPESYPSCRACDLLPLCFAHCPHSNYVLPDREPRCPTYKYNWRDVFPVYLNQRIARA